MASITLDDDLRSKLMGLIGPVAVRDESGRTVGQFLPQDEYIKLLYAWAKEEFARDDALRGPPLAYDGTNAIDTDELLKQLGALQIRPALN